MPNVQIIYSMGIRTIFQTGDSTIKGKNVGWKNRAEGQPPYYAFPGKNSLRVITLKLVETCCAYFEDFGLCQSEVVVVT